MVEAKSNIVLGDMRNDSIRDIFWRQISHILPTGRILLRNA